MRHATTMHKPVRFYAACAPGVLVTLQTTKRPRCSPPDSSAQVAMCDGPHNRDHRLSACSPAWIFRSSSNEPASALAASASARAAMARIHAEMASRASRRASPVRVIAVEAVIDPPDGAGSASARHRDRG
uniref:Uncharacterized protein n=1 Tax=Chrysotila carterae TaxID=13221 RepID=A0A7S4BCY0_CHRCT